MALSFNALSSSMLRYFLGDQPEHAPQDIETKPAVEPDFFQDMQLLDDSKALCGSAVSLASTAADSLPATPPDEIIAEMTGLKIPTDALTLLQNILTLKTAVEGYIDDRDKQLEHQIIEVHQKNDALKSELAQISHLISAAAQQGDTLTQQQLMLTQSSLLSKHKALVEHAQRIEHALAERALALRADLAHQSVKVSSNTLALATDIAALAHVSACLKMGLASSAVMTALAAVEGTKSHGQLNRAHAALSGVKTLQGDDAPAPLRRLGNTLADNAMRQINHLRPQRNDRLRQVAGWAAITAGAGVIVAGGGMLASAALVTAGTATLAYGALQRVANRVPAQEMKLPAPKALSQALGDQTLEALAADRPRLVHLGKKLGQDPEVFADSAKVLGLATVLDTLFQNDLGYLPDHGEPIPAAPKWAPMAAAVLVDVQQTAIEVVSGLHNGGLINMMSTYSTFNHCAIPNNRNNSWATSLPTL